MSQLLKALQSGRVLIMDGAMGTQLLHAGFAVDGCLEACNVNAADAVLAIHRAYVAAGAEVLLTNTFRAFPSHLALHGIEDQLEAIVRAGIALAREAAGEGRFILGALGPLGAGADELRRLLPLFRGVDGLLLETASNFGLVERVVAQCDIPVLFSACFKQSEQGPRTTSGPSAQDVAKHAAKLRVAALGVNCGREIDIDTIARIMKTYRQETDLALFARPNAGTPTACGGQWSYPLSPDRFAREMHAVLALKPAMVGGCCGTTPDHIAALARRQEA